MAESARQPKEPQNPEELYRYLLDRVTNMETRNLESGSNYARWNLINGISRPRKYDMNGKCGN